jgi:hypothetical protein
MKIPLWIHEADADQRKSQVTGFLTMISRQDTETTTIDGK